MKFFISPPNERRDTFVLVAYESGANGKRRYVNKEDPRLEPIRAKVGAINDLYKTSGLSRARCRKLLLGLMDGLYKKHKIDSPSAKASSLEGPNKKIFKDFWKSKYSRKENKDMASCRYDFIRSLKIIDQHPLLTTDPGRIDKILIDRCGRETAKRRRTAMKLNEILSFYNVKEKLVICREPRKIIKHVTLEDALTLSQRGDEIERLAVLTLFATGCRMGEALNLGASGNINEEKNTIYIDSQKSLKTAEIEEPKRGSSGHIFVIPEFWNDVMKWIDLPNKDRLLYEKIYRFVTRESRNLWPDKPTKHICVHDLRHSHAIYLLKKGANLHLVANNLRNSIVTCQKYYTGFSHTEGTTENLRRAITSSSSKEMTAAVDAQTR
jgi:integrase